MSKKAAKATGKPVVRLRGGPCDGWIVGDDAAMLVQEDWYDLIPEGAVAAGPLRPA